MSVTSSPCREVTPSEATRGGIWHDLDRYPCCHFCHMRMTPTFNAVSFFFLLQFALCMTTCPTQCHCSGTDIFCHERNLKAVPHHIPSDYTKLYLQGNDLGISELRLGLHEHKQLQVLILDDNKFKEFPLELPECLHNLKLQENDIRVISRSTLTRLPCLKELHLESNSLSEHTIELGSFKQLTSLTKLFLSDNNFSAVPLELPLGLEVLHMERNRIHSLSEHSFVNLTNLKELFLDGNSLKNAGIHVQAFSDLKNLQIISFKENGFTTLPEHLPDSLQKIYLGENNIAVILPNTLSHMANLSELILSRNKLSNLAFEAFDGVNKLRNLLLWNNPWICDCRLLWLKKRMLNKSMNIYGLKCTAPAPLRNRDLKSIGTEQLCSMTTTTTATTTTTTTTTTTRTTTPSVTNGTTNITQTFSTDDPSVFAMETAAMSTLASTVMTTHPSTLNGDLKVVIQSYVRRNIIVVQWNNTKPDAMYNLHWQKIGHVEEGHCIINGSEKEVELKVLEPSADYNISLELLPKVEAVKFSTCVEDVTECTN
uniref:leucine-rich repeat transmembrane protein FLRT1-like isoform X1 n=2 Tax=Myxine glutinosa TaxID=7769 RepID=UPI00358ED063